MATPKTVLITGCSLGGIGHALAREFHSRGHRVFATARSKAKMAELEALSITTLEMDVTSLESISAAAASVTSATDGKLDILINNAGLNHVMPLADCDMADVKRVLDTNIFGVFAVTHALLPLLIPARGVIASVSSVNTVFQPPYQTAYNASKAALNSFGQTLRIELAPLGVRVVTVVTGPVATHLFDNADERCHLPEGSAYTPLKERIEKKDFLDGIKWTPASDYAREVASDLLKEKPKQVLWRGAMSTAAWFLKAFGWDGMLDGAMGKGVGLDTLKPSVVG